MMTPRSNPILSCGIASLLAAAALHTEGSGADGSWNVDAAGNWSATGSWLNGVVADGVDSTANFRFNIAAGRTVTVDTARTIGNLVFEDATTASHDWTLASSGGNVLTLDVTTGPANITVLNRTATISSVLSGNDGINVSGALSGTTTGTLVLSGANTFTGGLSVTGGILQLNNAQAAGSNTITVGTSAHTGIANKLAINGGISIANDIIIKPGAAPIAGANGAVQQVGTGQATVNGNITIEGSTANAGHFAGGAAAGNELVINGPITSSVGVTHRFGRVIYRSGGTGYTGLSVTGTAIVGATNGISSAASLSVAISGNGTVDLNGFDQTVAGLTLGNGDSGNINSVATIAVGARTLGLTGNVTTRGNPTHSFTGTGTLDLGTNAALFSINDGVFADDLVIAPVVAGTAGFTKTGSGTLILNGNVTNTGPVTVNFGALGGNTTIAGAVTIDAGAMLMAGTASTAGTLNVPTLTLDAGALLQFNLGAGSDVINVTSANGFSTGGSNTVLIAPLGGPLPIGTYHLIGLSGAIQGAGLAGLELGPIGHSVASLINTGSTIALRITSTDSVIWTGAAGGAWDVDATQNWKLQSNNAATTYKDGDDVIFNDTAAIRDVQLDTFVTPARVTFNNSTAAPYFISGFGGISGSGLLIKNGNGAVTLQTLNSYTGPTNVNEGTLELDHDAFGNVVLSSTSVVNVAAGATLKLTRDNGGFTFNRDIVGTGSVELNAHSEAAGTNVQSITLSGNNSGFTGTLRLLEPVTGTYRLANPTPAQLGSGSVEVQNGAQVYTAANLVYNNSLNITGTGFADANGNIGALRLEPGSTWAGPVVVNGSARIGAHNGTATVSGNISGGDLSVNATNYNNNYTLTFTGTNSYGQTVIGGQNTQTAGVPSMRLNIGNGGTSGTLGTGAVIINGDGANGILGFDRADGYTLLAGQTITGAGSQPGRVFIDLDTLGAGFSDNGNAITLGTPAAGGNIRIAQARANAVANFSGNHTTGAFRVSTGQTGGTANILPGAVVNANTLFLGEAANMSATVNQAADTTVNVVAQLRVGHFSTETSRYNLNGGTITLTGASPNLSPSTAGAGAANQTGDNNINALPTNTTVGGGIYLGIDGTGVFNHNSGTVTTNWIVLDNRGDTGLAANMNGLDQYNLASGTLNIRSSWGIIGRNVSTEFNLNGGTVRIDNTGTGTGTGPFLTVPFDVLIRTSGNSTLDTNGTGNFWTLTRSILGNGSIALAGGGPINFNPNTGGGNGYQAVGASLSGGNPIFKLGPGTTAWTGSGSGYTGAIIVQAGRFEVPASLAASSLDVADVAAIAGEPTIPSVTLGTPTGVGATIFFDPSTPGALTATNLVFDGQAKLDFAAIPTGAGPWTALTYGTKSSSTAFFLLVNSQSYRSATVNDNGTGTVTVNVANKNLLWTGAGGTTWNLNTIGNWEDAGTPETFFSGDTVTFGDAGAGTVTINSQVSPWGVTVDSNNAYTFSGTGGITGPGGLTKSGGGTLTISTANSYAGRTDVNGGTLTFSNSANLGNNSVTNTIVLSDGGTLNATASVDLGLNRAIAIGTGGGIIAMSNAAAQTVTISGNLTGVNPLNVTSGAAGAPTFFVSGNNSGYSGDITVDSAGGGLSVLRLGSSKAVTGGKLTLLNPTTGASGAATTLDLNGWTLPAETTLVLNSLLSGTTSYRTQVISNAPGGTLEGPIQINGNSIVQFSTGSANGMTINGNITAGASGFTNALLIRGGGTGVINGTINIPGASLNKTDTGTWTINSTGNVWATTNVQNGGSLRLGINNALPITAALVIGQGSDASNSLLDLNGFNQEVASLSWIAGNANSTRAVGNTSAKLSTLTVNQATNTTYGASTGTTGGLLIGNLQLVKNGAGTLTLQGANTFTGNVIVNEGTLVAGGATVTSLGSPTTAGRTVTVNNASTLSFTTNNVFGNGLDNANLPTVTLNGSTLTSTRYNVLGDVILNGGTLTQAATDSGNYEGFQFRGAVTVSGTAPSTIETTNGKANHLGPNTAFNVADVTSSPAADLVVSSPLRDQSGDFGNAPGALTKSGPGTMELRGANSYSGSTTVAAGTLLVTGAISGSRTIDVQSGATLNVAAAPGGFTVGSAQTLTGAGTVAGPVAFSGTAAPGNGTGTLTLLDSAIFIAGSTLELEIAGPSSFDRLIASAVSLNGPVNLKIDLTYAPASGGPTSFLVLQNSGATPISGLFTWAGPEGVLSEGETFFVGSQPFSITYAGGTGNDVVLTAIPEPGSAALLLAALSATLGLRRNRNPLNTRSRPS